MRTKEAERMAGMTLDEMIAYLENPLRNEAGEIAMRPDALPLASIAYKKMGYKGKRVS